MKSDQKAFVSWAKRMWSNGEIGRLADAFMNYPPPDDVVNERQMVRFLQAKMPSNDVAALVVPIYRFWRQYVKE